MGKWLCMALLGLWAGCSQRDLLYCDSQSPCTDSVLRFCDVKGLFGPTNTCIGQVHPSQPNVLLCVSSIANCDTTAPICDGPTGVCRTCNTDAECAARSEETPYCTAGRCARCLSSNHCGNAAPVCDQGTCRPCRADGECLSGACNVGNGLCIEEGKILYVRTSGCRGGADGSRADPLCSPEEAIAAVRGPRSIIHLSEGNYPVNVTIDRSLTLVGERARLHPKDGNRTIITVSGSASVALRGLAIDAASEEAIGRGVECTGNGMTKLAVERSTIEGSASHGLDLSYCQATVEESTITGNETTGISVSNAKLVLRRSQVRNNPGIGIVATDSTLELDANEIRVNAGGGISLMTSSLSITNNVIVENGTPSSTFGGVLFNPGTSGLFTNNTIASNAASSASGILCPAATSVAITNSIVWNNGWAGQCAFGSSDVQGGAPGEANIDADPQFVGPSYRLRPSSPCKDAGKLGQAPDHDIDGHPRPRDQRIDIGADEL